MGAVTLRLPNGRHQRLKVMAQSYSVSLNELVEQVTAQALTENDIELRYRHMTAIGSAERGL